MSQLIDYWNTNIDNYDRARDGSIKCWDSYLVHSGLECHCTALYWNIYKLEIGNVIYDGSLF